MKKHTAMHALFVAHGKHWDAADLAPATWHYVPRQALQISTMSLAQITPSCVVFSDVCLLCKSVQWDWVSMWDCEHKADLTVEACECVQAQELQQRLKRHHVRLQYNDSDPLMPRTSGTCLHPRPPPAAGSEPLAQAAVSPLNLPDTHRTTAPWLLAYVQQMNRL